MYDTYVSEEIYIDAAIPEITIEDTRTSVLNRGWIAGLIGQKPLIDNIFTVYYPWIYSQWRAELQRRYRDNLTIAYKIGVDAIRPLVRLADAVPTSESMKIEERNVMKIRITDEEAMDEGREFIKTDILRRYRPIYPADITFENSKLLYVPINIVRLANHHPERWWAVDAITGMKMRLGKRYEILRFFKKTYDGRTIISL